MAITRTLIFACAWPRPAARSSTTRGLPSGTTRARAPSSGRSMLVQASSIAGASPMSGAPSSRKCTVAAMQPRTLFVSVFHPEIVRGGAQQAAYELFQGFRQANEDAIFLASVEPGNAPSLFKPGAIVTGFRPARERVPVPVGFVRAQLVPNVNVRAIRSFAEFPARDEARCGAFPPLHDHGPRPVPDGPEGIA